MVNLRILSTLIAGFVAASQLISCGNRTPLKKVPTKQKSGDQKAAIVNNACINPVQCPQLPIALSGISGLGGSAEALLTWDVGGLTPDDKTRQIMVTMATPLPGMEVISKATDPRVSVNWKPMDAQTGIMQFRARDVSRCQKVMAGSVNCADLSIPQPQFEQILPIPYQVVPKNETFNAAQSDFFRQFHCEAQGITKGEKAIITGVSTIGGAIGGAALGGVSYFDVSGMIHDSCDDCHSAKGEFTPHLDTFDDLKANARAALAAMQSTDPKRKMPPSTTINRSPTSEEIREFSQWISSGMPYSTTANGARSGLSNVGGVERGVATIVDYLVNGDVQPTAYECLKRNAQSNIPVQTSTLP